MTAHEHQSGETLSESTNVAIIGAGDMGHGFAIHFTLVDQPTTLIDHARENLDEAHSRIRTVVNFLREAGMTSKTPDDVVENVTFTLETATGVDDAGLVLESVSEDLDVKQAVLAEAGNAAPSDAILASNTSGIPITDIAEGVPDYASRIVGCHWWYPPYLLRPVEVVRGEQTDQAVVDRLERFLKSVGRDPISVKRDVPGFVWNRVQLAIFRECLHLVEAGVASAEDVDRAIRDGYAVRTAAVGPFESMDIAGLHLIQTVATGLTPHLCSESEISPLLEEHLAAGRGGIEDGAGFLSYDEPPEAITRARDQAIVEIQRGRSDAGLPGEDYEA